MSRGAGVALLATLAAGCAPQRDRLAPVVRDSAGTRIVENRLARSSPPRAAPLSIDTDPALDLGAGDDPEETTFNRIAEVRLRAGGGLVVAEEGESRIRAFDASGRLVWAAGTNGDGPGEYRLIAGLGIGPADSIWVWDYGLRRMTILDGAGRVARVLPLGAALSNVGVAGRLADGTFVLQEYWTSGGGGGPGLQRSPAAIVRFAADGSSIDTVAVLPGREVFLSMEDGRAVMAAPLFARRTVATARDGAIFAGDQARYEIGRYDAAGILRMSIRLMGLDLSIDDGAARSLVDAMLEEAPREERQDRRSFLESMDRPSSRPAFTDILATDSGLWVGDWDLPGRSASSWTVFSADGTNLGQLAMPSAFEPRDVRGDRVAGIWRDALGVEHVRVHRILNRPGAA